MESLATSAVLAKSAGFGDNPCYPTREMAGVMAQTQEDKELEKNQLAELIRLGVEGDEWALEAIYHRFKNPLFNLACRYTGNAATAEDVLQEVFLKAFSHLREVDNVATFPGWLFRIAINTSLSHLRSRKAEMRSSVPLSEVEAVLASPSSNGEYASALRKPLEDAIQALPQRLKSVFLLHDVQGYKHEEIASILSCTVGTSKSHLFKARMKLRDRLVRTKAL